MKAFLGIFLLVAVAAGIVWQILFGKIYYDRSNF